MACSAPDSVQAQFILKQLVHGVPIGANFARQMRFVKPLRGVTRRAQILDGLTVVGVDQSFMGHFGTPKGVFGAIGHHGGLPVYDGAHRVSIDIHQGFSIWIRSVAIHAIPRTCEINPLFRAELTHSPPHFRGIISMKRHLGIGRS